MKHFVYALSFLIFSTTAHAIDGIGFELGNGDATDMGRVSAIWDWNKKWGNDYIVTGYWEASLGFWKGDSSAGDNQDIVDVGFTPVFRFQPNKKSGFIPYAEAAIGFHLLSKTRINADRKFGSAFQFGDHIGVGARFGEKGQYDLGYRFQHLSNGSIKEPNNGINFNQIHFLYRF